MTLSRTKPVDDLYDEVAGFDLVVVPDAPLASALNRRLERPHFGPFAITPRRLAARRRETAEDRIAFLEVIGTTDLDWKRAAEAIGNVLQCWEETGSPDTILEYEAFDTETTRTVLETIRSLDTTSRALTEYRIDPAEYPAVAVVEPAQLTPLERSILPDEYTAVDRFTDDPFDLPPVRIFDSPAAVVEAVVGTISPETAEDVAVVLDGGSSYSTLLESALEAAEIPFYGGPGFTDDRDLRAFIDLLRTVYAGSDTRVEDVRPLLTHLGIDLDIGHENKRLFAIDDPALSELRAFCLDATPATVEEALDRYGGLLGRDLSQLRAELDQLGVLTEPLTERIVERVVFYLQTYEVPIDRENDGVLLADATSAAYVDRPVVFCLGLDDGWTHSAPRRPWVDRSDRFERNIRSFQSLLQSGVDQHYLVVDVAGGEPVPPTVYFEALLEDEVERFSDLESIEHTRTVRTTAGGFDRTPLGLDVDSVETISQSSLSSFVNSPRDYLFDRLLAGPDSAHLEEGTWFHDFAELFVAAPDVVTHPDGTIDSDAIDELTDLLLEDLHPFYSALELDVQRTRYRVGLTILATILTDLDPDPGAHELDLESPDWHSNDLAAALGITVDSPLTEVWFEDTDSGLRGLIDLIAGPTHLVDFKTGSKKSTTEITKQSSLDPVSSPPDYQALAYLTYWSRQRPGERLQFSFVHFLECLDDAVTDEPTLEECYTTLEYRPITFREYTKTEEVFEGLCGDAANNCNKTFSKVDHEIFRSFLEDHPVPKTRSNDEILADPFCSDLTEHMVAAVGDYKYVKTGCRQACKYLVGCRRRTYFADDVEAFERFVAERIEELNAYRRGERRFPIEGPGAEVHYRWVDNRDLLLESGGDSR